MKPVLVGPLQLAQVAARAVTSRLGLMSLVWTSSFSRNTPDEFVQADALAVLRHLADDGCFKTDSCTVRRQDIAAIHASPPCQGFSQLAIARGDGTQDKYVNMSPDTRDLLQAIGLPYVIETVAQAPLADDAVLLCGTQFGRQDRWHRKFECSFPVDRLTCDHSITTYNPFTMKGWHKIQADYGHSPNPEKRFHLWRGVDWTNASKEKREALPPVYTTYIGAFLLRSLPCRGKRR